MSDAASLFSPENFRTTLKQYASQNAWEIAEIDDEHAVFTFEIEESGRQYEVDVARYDTALEFWVPSSIEVEADKDVPQEVAVTLLKRNSESKVGFWCLAETDDGLFLGCMHNAEVQLLTAEYFQDIVSALIDECDDLEQALEDLEDEEDNAAL